MRFTATNFSVSILLLIALTIFMASIRMRKPLENSWVLMYWILLTAATIMNPDIAFDFRFVAAGLLAGLLLRFEFMNRAVTKVVMAVEAVVFAYIVIAGGRMIFSR